MEIGFLLAAAVFGLLLIMIASSGGNKQPADPEVELRDSRRQPLMLKKYGQAGTRSSCDYDDHYEEPWTQEQYDQRWKEIFDDQRRGHEEAVRSNAEYAARTQEMIDARLQREADQARRDGDWWTNLGR